MSKTSIPRLNSDKTGVGPRNRLGAVTVEFALTIGLAFFFFWAAFEFCRVAMLRHTIENAVYEGGRMAIVPGGTKADVETEVRRIMNIIGVRNPVTTVQPETLTLTTKEVTVTVSIPLSGNLYLPAKFFKGSELTRSITMLRETPSNAR